MPEETTTATNETAESSGKASDGKANNNGWTPPASQEEFNKLLGDRLRAERAKYADYNDLKAKAAQFDEASEAQKTEAQKAADALAAQTRRADAAEARIKALSIATEHQLDAEDAELVAAQPDEDAARKLAERLAKVRDAAQQSSSKVGYSVDHSGTQSSPPPSKDDAARAFFGI